MDDTETENQDTEQVDNEMQEYPPLDEDGDLVNLGELG
jgi:hypothetical protein